MTKQCTKCKEVKSLNMFYKNISTKDKLTRCCIQCEKIKNNEYKLKNKDKLKEYRLNNRNKIKEYKLSIKDKIQKSSKEYYLKNKDKIIEYRLENKDKLNKKHRVSKQNQRDRLADSYIKEILIKSSLLSFKDIPQWLIEAKREELQLKRIIRKEHDER